ncbi:MAG: hypothetical protein IJW78_05675, partial [Clostridia bacterium]|nr:hypothetical protein [Clostridia bacterium]
RIKIVIDQKKKTEYGLQICGNGEKIKVEQISTERRIVKDIIRKLKPYNISPEIAKEIIEDLISEFGCSAEL